MSALVGWVLDEDSASLPVCIAHTFLGQRERMGGGWLGEVGRGWTKAYGSHCKLPVNADGSDRNQIFVNFSTHTHKHFADNQSKFSFPLSPFSLSFGSLDIVCNAFSLRFSLSLLVRIPS